MEQQKTGGAAFPMPIGHAPERDVYEWNKAQFGMTLRDYFAAKAMQTLLGSEYTSDHGLHEGWMRSLAHEAYQVADAMLAAREGR
jgi:hypothetical protein